MRNRCALDSLSLFPVMLQRISMRQERIDGRLRHALEFAAVKIASAAIARPFSGTQRAMPT
jgi:hypothetical protein